MPTLHSVGATNMIKSELLKDKGVLIVSPVGPLVVKTRRKSPSPLADFRARSHSHRSEHPHHTRRSC